MNATGCATETFIKDNTALLDYVVSLLLHRNVPATTTEMPHNPKWTTNVYNKNPPTQPQKSPTSNIAYCIPHIRNNVMVISELCDV